MRPGSRSTPVPGLCATTAAGLARRLTASAVGGGGDRARRRARRRAGRAGRGGTRRAAALAESVTIDLDTTDVEVYGRQKRGVAYNHQGQRVGRPHVATWAETATVLAADLRRGNEDPAATRAGAAAPRAGRAAGRGAGRGGWRMRADAGYFAGQLARAAHVAEIEFAIGARRIAPLWRLLAGIAEDDWTRRDRHGRCPGRRGRLLPGLVARRDPAADPPGPPRWTRPRSPPTRGSRRRRTLHPDQRALPLAELAAAPSRSTPTRSS